MSSFKIVSFFSKIQHTNVNDVFKFEVSEVGCISFRVVQDTAPSINL